MTAKASSTPELAPQEPTHVVVIGGGVAHRGDLASAMAYAKANCALTPTVLTMDAYTTQKARITTPKAAPVAGIKEAVDALVADGWAKSNNIVKWAHDNPNSPLSPKQHSAIMAMAAGLKERQTKKAIQARWDGTWKIVRGEVAVITKLTYDAGCETLRSYHEDPATKDARLVRSNA